MSHPPTSTRIFRRTTALPLRIALLVVLVAVAVAVWLLGPPSLNAVFPMGEELRHNIQDSE